MRIVLAKQIPKLPALLATVCGAWTKISPEVVWDVLMRFGKVTNQSWALALLRATV